VNIKLCFTYDRIFYMYIDLMGGLSAESEPTVKKTKYIRNPHGLLLTSVA